MSLVVLFHLLKIETRRDRVTIGSDCLEHKGFTSIVSVTLTTFQTLLSSTISIPDAQCLKLDVKDYHYETPMR